MIRIINGLFFAVAVSGMLGCWGKTIFVEKINPLADVDQKYLSDNIKQKEYNRSLNFGITVSKNETSIRYAYKPFVDYLAEQLQYNVRLIVVNEYSELERDMASGIIHLADFPPLGFVRAYDNLREKIQYLATYTQLTEGISRPYYRGLIFSRKSAEIKNLAAMQNKKIVFVERSSSSGYYYPMSLLLSKGIDPETYFSRIIFAGSHDRVVESVIKGSADLGATYDAFFERSQKVNNQQLYKILETEPIPNVALCAAASLPYELRLKIQRLITAINPSSKTSDGRKVFDAAREFPSDGLVTKSPQFYDYVRQTEQLLNKNQRLRN